MKVTDVQKRGYGVFILRTLKLYLSLLEDKKGYLKKSEVYSCINELEEKITEIK